MDRCKELIDSCVITLRVLCTVLVRCLSPCSMCPDCVVCVNSPVSTVRWCTDGDWSLPLWWGPQSGLWPKCVQQGLMQPHRHSRRDSALATCDWGSGQLSDVNFGTSITQLLYTTPLRWSDDTGSLGCTSILRRVFSGQKTTLMRTFSYSQQTRAGPHWWWTGQIIYDEKMQRMLS